MIRSDYHCCINEPVIFSHCVHLKLGHRFHALLKVCSDRDDIVPLYVQVATHNRYYLNRHLGFGFELVSSKNAEGDKS